MSERRNDTRFKTLGLHTPFGEVLNISDSGLGVFRKGKPELEIGDTVTLHIIHEGIKVDLTAKVVRIDAAGLSRQEIGFEFIEADEDQLTKIWSLADQACSEFSGPTCWVAA